MAKFRFLFIAWFLTSVQIGNAQLLPAQHTPKEAQEFSKIQERLIQAEENNQKVIAIQKELDSIENLGIGFLAKKIALQNELQLRVISNSNQFSDAYRDQFKLLAETWDSYLAEKKTPEQLDRLSESTLQGKQMMKQAKKLYRKAGSYSNYVRIMETTLQARKLQTQAISLFAIFNPKEPSTEKPAELVGIQEKDKFISSTIFPPTPNTPDEKLYLSVYYTLQICAARQPESEANLKRKYSGTLPWLTNEEGGWYRYSVGKFSSLEEAQKTLQTEAITGFVAAYRDKSRIAVAEARKILGK